MDSPGIVRVPRNAVISFPPALMVRTSSSSRIMDLLLPTEFIVSNDLRFGMFLPLVFIVDHRFVLCSISLFKSLASTRYNLVHTLCVPGTGELHCHGIRMFNCRQGAEKTYSILQPFCFFANFASEMRCLSATAKKKITSFSCPFIHKNYNDICYLFLLQLS